MKLTELLKKRIKFAGNSFDRIEFNKIEFARKLFAIFVIMMFMSSGVSFEVVAENHEPASAGAGQISQEDADRLAAASKEKGFEERELKDEDYNNADAYEGNPPKIFTNPKFDITKVPANKIEQNIDAIIRMGRQNSLTQDQVRAITDPGRISTLLQNLDPANIGRFSPDQIGSLSSEQLIALNPTQRAALTTEQLSNGNVLVNVGNLRDLHPTNLQVAMRARYGLAEGALFLISPGAGEVTITADGKIKNGPGSTIDIETIKGTDVMSVVISKPQDADSGFKICRTSTKPGKGCDFVKLSPETGEQMQYTFDPQTGKPYMEITKPDGTKTRIELHGEVHILGRDGITVIEVGEGSAISVLHGKESYTITGHDNNVVVNLNTAERLLSVTSKNPLSGPQFTIKSESIDGTVHGAELFLRNDERGELIDVTAKRPPIPEKFVGLPPGASADLKIKIDRTIPPIIKDAHYRLNGLGNLKFERDTSGELLAVKYDKNKYTFTKEGKEVTEYDHADISVIQIVNGKEVEKALANHQADIYLSTSAELRSGKGASVQDISTILAGLLGVQNKINAITEDTPLEDRKVKLQVIRLGNDGSREIVEEEIKCTSDMSLDVCKAHLTTGTNKIALRNRIVLNKLSEREAGGRSYVTLTSDASGVLHTGAVASTSGGEDGNTLTVDRDGTKSRLEFGKSAAVYIAPFDALDPNANQKYVSAIPPNIEGVTIDNLYTNNKEFYDEPTDLVKETRTLPLQKTLEEGGVLEVKVGPNGKFYALNTRTGVYNEYDVDKGEVIGSVISNNQILDNLRDIEITEVTTSHKGAIASKVASQDIDVFKRFAAEGNVDKFKGGLAFADRSSYRSFLNNDVIILGKNPEKLTEIRTPDGRIPNVFELNKDTKKLVAAGFANVLTDFEGGEVQLRRKDGTITAAASLDTGILQLAKEDIEKTRAIIGYSEQVIKGYKPDVKGIDDLAEKVVGLYISKAQKEGKTGQEITKLQTALEQNVRTQLKESFGAKGEAIGHTLDAARLSYEAGLTYTKDAADKKRVQAVDEVKQFIKGTGDRFAVQQGIGLIKEEFKLTGNHEGTRNLIQGIILGTDKSLGFNLDSLSFPERQELGLELEKIGASTFSDAKDFDGNIAELKRLSAKYNQNLDDEIGRVMLQRIDEFKQGFAVLSREDYDKLDPSEQKEYDAKKTAYSAYLKASGSTVELKTPEQLKLLSEAERTAYNTQLSAALAAANTKARTDTNDYLKDAISKQSLTPEQRAALLSTLAASLASEGNLEKIQDISVANADPNIKASLALLSEKQRNEVKASFAKTLAANVDETKLAALRQSAEFAALPADIQAQLVYSAYERLFNSAASNEEKVRLAQLAISAGKETGVPVSPELYKTLSRIYASQGKYLESDLANREAAAALQVKAATQNYDSRKGFNFGTFVQGLDELARDNIEVQYAQKRYGAVIASGTFVVGATNLDRSAGDALDNNVRNAMANSYSTLADEAIYKNEKSELYRQSDEESSTIISNARGALTDKNVAKNVKELEVLEGQWISSVSAKAVNAQKQDTIDSLKKGKDDIGDAIEELKAAKEANQIKGIIIDKDGNPVDRIAELVKQKHGIALGLAGKLLEDGSKAAGNADQADRLYAEILGADSGSTPDQKASAKLGRLNVALIKGERDAARERITDIINDPNIKQEFKDRANAQKAQIDYLDAQDILAKKDLTDDDKIKLKRLLGDIEGNANANPALKNAGRKTLANLFRAEGDLDGAIEQLNKIRNDPKSSLQEIAEAETQITKIGNIKLYTEANRLLQAGNIDEAMRAYEQLLGENVAPEIRESAANSIKNIEGTRLKLEGEALFNAHNVFLNVQRFTGLTDRNTNVNTLLEDLRRRLNNQELSPQERERIQSYITELETLSQEETANSMLEKAKEKFLDDKVDRYTAVGPEKGSVDNYLRAIAEQQEQANSGKVQEYLATKLQQLEARAGGIRAEAASAHSEVTSAEQRLSEANARKAAGQEVSNAEIAQLEYEVNRLKTKESNVHLELANLLSNDNRKTQEAKDAYNSAISSNANNINAMSGLAYLERREGNYQDAKTAYEKALAVAEPEYRERITQQINQVEVLDMAKMFTEGRIDSAWLRSQQLKESGIDIGQVGGSLHGQEQQLAGDMALLFSKGEEKFLEIRNSENFQRELIRLGNLQEKITSSTGLQSSLLRTQSERAIIAMKELLTADLNNPALFQRYQAEKADAAIREDFVNAALNPRSVDMKVQVGDPLRYLDAGSNGISSNADSERYRAQQVSKVIYALTSTNDPEMARLVMDRLAVNDPSNTWQRASTVAEIAQGMERIRLNLVANGDLSGLERFGTQKTEVETRIIDSAKLFLEDSSLRKFDDQAADMLRYVSSDNPSRAQFLSELEGISATRIQFVAAQGTDLTADLVNGNEKRRAASLMLAEAYRGTEKEVQYKQNALDSQKQVYLVGHARLQEEGNQFEQESAQREQGRLARIAFDSGLATQTQALNNFGLSREQIISGQIPPDKLKQYQTYMAQQRASSESTVLGSQQAASKEDGSWWTNYDTLRAHNVDALITEHQRAALEQANVDFIGQQLALTRQAGTGKIGEIRTRLLEPQLDYYENTASLLGEDRKVGGKETITIKSVQDAEIRRSQLTALKDFYEIQEQGGGLKITPEKKIELMSALGVSTYSRGGDFKETTLREFDKLMSSENADDMLRVAILKRQYNDYRNKVDATNTQFQDRNKEYSGVFAGTANTIGSYGQGEIDKAGEQFSVYYNAHVNLANEMEKLQQGLQGKRFTEHEQNIIDGALLSIEGGLRDQENQLVQSKLMDWVDTGLTVTGVWNRASLGTVVRVASGELEDNRANIQATTAKRSLEAQQIKFVMDRANDAGYTYQEATSMPKDKFLEASARRYVEVAGERIQIKRYVEGAENVETIASPENGKPIARYYLRTEDTEFKLDENGNHVQGSDGSWLRQSQWVPVSKKDLESKKAQLEQEKARLVQQGPVGDTIPPELERVSNELAQVEQTLTNVVDISQHATKEGKPNIKSEGINTEKRKDYGQIFDSAVDSPMFHASTRNPDGTLSFAQMNIQGDLSDKDFTIMRSEGISAFADAVISPSGLVMGAGMGAALGAAARGVKGGYAAVNTALVSRAAVAEAGTMIKLAAGTSNLVGTGATWATAPGRAFYTVSDKLDDVGRGIARGLGGRGGTVLEEGLLQSGKRIATEGLGAFKGVTLKELAARSAQSAYGNLIVQNAYEEGVLNQLGGKYTSGLDSATGDIISAGHLGIDTGSIKIGLPEMGYSDVSEMASGAMKGRGGRGLVSSMVQRANQQQNFKTTSIATSMGVRIAVVAPTRGDANKFLQTPEVRKGLDSGRLEFVSYDANGNEVARGIGQSSPLLENGGRIELSPITGDSPPIVITTQDAKAPTLQEGPKLITSEGIVQSEVVGSRAYLSNVAASLRAEQTTGGLLKLSVATGIVEKPRVRNVHEDTVNGVVTYEELNGEDYVTKVVQVGNARTLQDGTTVIEAPKVASFRTSSGESVDVKSQIDEAQRVNALSNSLVVADIKDAGAESGLGRVKVSKSSVFTTETGSSVQVIDVSDSNGKQLSQEQKDALVNQLAAKEYTIDPSTKSSDRIVATQVVDGETQTFVINTGHVRSVALKSQTRSIVEGDTLRINGKEVKLFAEEKPTISNSEVLVNSEGEVITQREVSDYDNFAAYVKRASKDPNSGITIVETKHSSLGVESAIVYEQNGRTLIVSRQGTEIKSVKGEDVRTLRDSLASTLSEKVAQGDPATSTAATDEKVRKKGFAASLFDIFTGKPSTENTPEIQAMTNNAVVALRNLAANPEQSIAALVELGLVKVGENFELTVTDPVVDNLLNGKLREQERRAEMLDRLLSGNEALANVDAQVRAKQKEFDRAKAAEKNLDELQAERDAELYLLQTQSAQTPENIAQGAELIRLINEDKPKLVAARQKREQLEAELKAANNLLVSVREQSIEKQHGLALEENARRDALAREEAEKKSREDEQRKLKEAAGGQSSAGPSTPTAPQGPQAPTGPSTKPSGPTQATTTPIDRLSEQGVSQANIDLLKQAGIDTVEKLAGYDANRLTTEVGQITFSTAIDSDKIIAARDKILPTVTPTIAGQQPSVAPTTVAPAPTPADTATTPRTEAPTDTKPVAPSEQQPIAQPAVALRNAFDVKTEVEKAESAMNKAKTEYEKLQKQADELKAKNGERDVKTIGAIAKANEAKKRLDDAINIHKSLDDELDLAQKIPDAKKAAEDAQKEYDSAQKDVAYLKEIENLAIARKGKDFAEKIKGDAAKRAEAAKTKLDKAQADVKTAAEDLATLLKQRQADALSRFKDKLAGELSRADINSYAAATDASYTNILTAAGIDADNPEALGEIAKALEAKINTATGKDKIALQNMLGLTHIEQGNAHKSSDNLGTAKQSYESAQSVLEKAAKADSEFSNGVGKKIITARRNLGNNVRGSAKYIGSWAMSIAGYGAYPGAAVLGGIGVVTIPLEYTYRFVTHPFKTIGRTIAAPFVGVGKPIWQRIKESNSEKKADESTSEKTGDESATEKKAEHEHWLVTEMFFTGLDKAGLIRSRQILAAVPVLWSKSKTAREIAKGLSKDAKKEFDAKKLPVTKAPAKSIRDNLGAAKNELRKLDNKERAEAAAPLTEGSGVANGINNGLNTLNALNANEVIAAAEAIANAEKDAANYIADHTGAPPETAKVAAEAAVAARPCSTCIPITLFVNNINEKVRQVIQEENIRRENEGKPQITISEGVSDGIIDRMAGEIINDYLHGLTNDKDIKNNIAQLSETLNYLKENGFINTDVEKRMQQIALQRMAAAELQLGVQAFKAGNYLDAAKLFAKQLKYAEEGGSSSLTKDELIKLLKTAGVRAKITAPNEFIATLESSTAVINGEAIPITELNNLKDKAVDALEYKKVELAFIKGECVGCSFYQLKKADGKTEIIKIVGTVEEVEAALKQIDAERKVRQEILNDRKVIEQRISELKLRQAISKAKATSAELFAARFKPYGSQNTMKKAARALVAQVQEIAISYNKQAIKDGFLSDDAASEILDRVHNAIIKIEGDKDLKIKILMKELAEFAAGEQELIAGFGNIQGITQQQSYATLLDFVSAEMAHPELLDGITIDAKDGKPAKSFARNSRIRYDHNNNPYLDVRFRNDRQIAGIKKNGEIKDGEDLAVRITPNAENKCCSVNIVNIGGKPITLTELKLSPKQETAVEKATQEFKNALKEISARRKEEQRRTRLKEFAESRFKDKGVKKSFEKININKELMPAITKIINTKLDSKKTSGEFFMKIEKRVYEENKEFFDALAGGQTGTSTETFTAGSGKSVFGLVQSSELYRYALVSELAKLEGRDIGKEIELEEEQRERIAIQKKHPVVITPSIIAPDINSIQENAERAAAATAVNTGTTAGTTGIAAGIAGAQATLTSTGSTGFQIKLSPQELIKYMRKTLQEKIGNAPRDAEKEIAVRNELNELIRLGRLPEISKENLDKAVKALAARVFVKCSECSLTDAKKAADDAATELNPILGRESAAQAAGAIDTIRERESNRIRDAHIVMAKLPDQRQSAFPGQIDLALRRIAGIKTEFTDEIRAQAKKYIVLLNAKISESDIDKDAPLNAIIGKDTAIEEDGAIKKDTGKIPLGKTIAIEPFIIPGTGNALTANYVALFRTENGYELIYYDKNGVGLKGVGIKNLKLEELKKFKFEKNEINQAIDEVLEEKALIGEKDYINNIFLKLSNQPKPNSVYKSLLDVPGYSKLHAKEFGALNDLYQNHDKAVKKFATFERDAVGNPQYNIADNPAHKIAKLEAEGYSRKFKEATYGRYEVLFDGKDTYIVAAGTTMEEVKQEIVQVMESAKDGIPQGLPAETIEDKLKKGEKSGEKRAEQPSKQPSILPAKSILPGSILTEQHNEILTNLDNILERVKRNGEIISAQNIDFNKLTQETKDAVAKIDESIEELRKDIREGKAAPSSAGYVIELMKGARNAHLRVLYEVVSKAAAEGIPVSEEDINAIDKLRTEGYLKAQADALFAPQVKEAAYKTEAYKQFKKNAANNARVRELIRQLPGFGGSSDATPIDTNDPKIQGRIYQAFVEENIYFIRIGTRAGKSNYKIWNSDMDFEVVAPGEWVEAVYPEFRQVLRLTHPAELAKGESFGYDVKTAEQGKVNRRLSAEDMLNPDYFKGGNTFVMLYALEGEAYTLSNGQLIADTKKATQLKKVHEKINYERRDGLELILRQMEDVFKYSKALDKTKAPDETNVRKVSKALLREYLGRMVASREMIDDVNKVKLEDILNSEVPTDYIMQLAKKALDKGIITNDELRLLEISNKIYGNGIPVQKVFNKGNRYNSNEDNKGALSDKGALPLSPELPESAESDYSSALAGFMDSARTVVLRHYESAKQELIDDKQYNKFGTESSAESSTGSIIRSVIRYIIGSGTESSTKLTELSIEELSMLESIVVDYEKAKQPKNKNAGKEEAGKEKAEKENDAVLNFRNNYDKNLEELLKDASPQRQDELLRELNRRTQEIDIEIKAASIDPEITSFDDIGKLGKPEALSELIEKISASEQIAEQPSSDAERDARQKRLSSARGPAAFNNLLSSQRRDLARRSYVFIGIMCLTYTIEQCKQAKAEQRRYLEQFQAAMKKIEQASLNQNIKDLLAAKIKSGSLQAIEIDGAILAAEVSDSSLDAKVRDKIISGLESGKILPEHINTQNKVCKPKQCKEECVLPEIYSIKAECAQAKVCCIIPEHSS